MDNVTISRDSITISTSIDWRMLIDNQIKAAFDNRHIIASVRINGSLYLLTKHEKPTNRYQILRIDSPTVVFAADCSEAMAEAFDRFIEDYYKLPVRLRDQITD